MRALLFALAASAAVAGKLYGFSQEACLVTIDPSTGKTVCEGSPIPFELQAQGLSAIDPAKKLYYLLGFNRSDTKANLVGVDLASGAVVSSANLPFAESAFVGVGQSIDVDPKDGNLFAGGRLVAKGPHTVGKVDPATGAYNALVSFNSTDLPVLGASTTFDPVTRQLFVQFGTPAGGITIYGVDVDNKKVTGIVQDPEDGRDITTMAYDPKSQTVLGLGVKPNNGTIERTLVQLHPASRTISTVAVVQGWLIESGGESALDASARTLYWIGQPTGAKPTDPFSLVGLDADTGAVKSNASLCPNDAACPWSIAVDPSA